MKLRSQNRVAQTVENQQRERKESVQIVINEPKIILNDILCDQSNESELAAELSHISLDSGDESVIFVHDEKPKQEREIDALKKMVATM